MKQQYIKPVVNVRRVDIDNSLLAASDIVIEKDGNSYSGQFHAKGFSIWNEDLQTDAIDSNRK